MAERHRSLPRWVRLSATYSADRRIRRAGPTAELVWLRGLTMARLHGTDGHLYSEWLAEDLGRGLPAEESLKAVDNLVAEGLWEPCDDGWRVPPNTYAKWQDTEADYEAQREKDRVRKAAWREGKREPPA